MVLRYCIFLLYICFAFTAEQTKTDYSNYKLVGIKINSITDKAVAESLKSDYLFLENPAKLGNKYQVLVPPSKLTQFIKALGSIQYTIDVDDLQKLIDLEQKPHKVANVDETFWSQYQSLDNIQNWLRNITAAHPRITRLVEIGRSYQNRSILALEIAYRPGNRAIFIESHIHAREWITSATVTWIVNQLLNSPDPGVRYLAERVNWYIVPNINPDGYEFSRTSNRMWRKTRSVNNGTSCVGVDGNRNFDFAWGLNGGASSNPCDETYAGPSAFSEVETQALRDYFNRVSSNVGVYLTFHSYGQWMLYPYGQEASRPPNVNQLNFVGNATTQAIAQRYGTKYIYGTTFEWLYTASGISTDWAFSTRPYQLLAYTIELRDNGTTGFILPPEQIIPTAQETLDGLMAMHQAAASFGFLNN